MTQAKRVGFLLFMLVAVACSSRTQPRPRTDAGDVDSSVDVDAGTLPEDASLLDSSMPTDAARDAATPSDASTADATVIDSGNTDSGVTVDAGVSRCTAMDAAGTGGCDFVLGYKYDGRRCIQVSGCECSGADCGDLKTSAQDCVDDHAECIRSCGGRGGSSLCPTGSYCRWEASELCGSFDSGGTCTEVPGTCDDVLSTVCGCDGMTYGNACFAAQNSTSVRSTGACAEP